MATTARSPPQQPSSNGVIVAPPKGIVGGNRKKQKRRAKQAAKAAAQDPAPLSPVGDNIDYDEDPLGYAEEDDYEYSDAEQRRYLDTNHYPQAHAGVNGHGAPSAAASKKNKKKKKRGGGGLGHGDIPDAYDPDMLDARIPDLPHPPNSVSAHKGAHRQQNIWNTTSQQERQNIRNFWLSLSEEERKSLLKIEKEAVLRKMKQQQKHSCSCTVCGRKRTAIEEELEVLYEGYYQELEHYAHYDHPPLPGADGMLPAPLAHPHAHQSRSITAGPPPPPPSQSHHRTSQILEHLEEDEEYSDDEAEYSDDEDYSEEDLEPPRGPVPDFFNFGQNLTVKDNLLTVADDLLKNDGRKFIEMMEQLAERRMQRENEAEYAAANPSHPGGYHPNDPAYNNDDPMAPSDDFDDDEASYDSQEDYDDELEEDDEMSALTEEQRMQEGRRMFQIFAARMFEHRVLTAYKEKVAAERQQRLLEELQNEEQLEAQREAKKKRDAEKKKDKKKQQQAAKAEERAKREAEKAAEEARLREAEEKKQEEQRRKKEEQRRKKEEERRKLEEERSRKEADRLRRQQEEQSRREEAERKAREQKAAEKARKEEAKRREKEEREAREQSAKDRKAQEEKEKRDSEVVKSKTDRSAPHNATESSQSQAPQVAKRPSHTNMVAVPGVLTNQQSTASPKVGTTAAMSKTVPTPANKKQSSQQGSHASSPRQAQSHASSAPSKSTSPGVANTSQPHSQAPKTILQKPVQAQQNMPQGHAQPFSPMSQQTIPPPPGMPIPIQQQQQQQQQHQPQQQQAPHHLPNAFSPMAPMGYPAFQNQPGHTLAGGVRSPLPMHPHTGPPNLAQGRMPSYQTGPGMNAPHVAPPGILANQGRNVGFPFDAHAPNTVVPPGFGPQASSQIASQISPIGPNVNTPLSSTSKDGPRTGLGSHSRQHSVSDKAFDTTIGQQPVSRPAPIQRPHDAKPQDEHTDVDGLAKQLGSSALGGDDDAQPLARRSSQRPLDGIAAGFGGAAGSFGAPGTTWNTPFTQTPGLGQQWGTLPQSNMSGWSNNASGFGTIGTGAGLGRPGLHGTNRPLTIRIAVCQACQQLSGGSGRPQEFHDVGTLLRQIESMRPPLDAPPSLTEIELICETEGDAQNGGGELAVRKAGNGAVVAVRWQPDSSSAPDAGRIGGIGALGEIGSPLPGKSTPAMGFGAPGMGRVVGSGSATGSGWPSGHHGGF